MLRLAHSLDDCRLPLLLLTTLLLAIGCGLMRMMRSPAHRQRTGELTLAAIFGWWFLACLPLPRLLPQDAWTRPYFPAAPARDTTADLDHAAASIGPADPGLLSLLREGETSSDAPPGFLTEPLSAAPVGDALEVATPRAGGPLVENRSGAPSGRPQRGPGFSAGLPEAPTAMSRVAAVYLGGAVVCAIWLGFGRLRLGRIRRSARRPPAWLAQMFEALADEVGERPLLLVSRHTTRPISWGTWRPTIVLPVALARRRHREQLRMVLLHELAHVVRRDGWGNGLVCLSLPLLYPHPLFWWLRAQVRMAVELLADDWAAQRGGKLAYVEQLVSLAKVSAKSSGFWPLAEALALYSSSSQFYRRMQMLISRTCPLSVVPTARWRLSSFGMAALLAVAAASLAGARPAKGQQPLSEAKPTASEDLTQSTTLSSDLSKTPDSDEAPVSDKKAESDRPLENVPFLGRLFAVAEGAPDAASTSADEQSLPARLAAAEERVRFLEGQLKTAASGKSAPEQPKSVTLTRVAEDGSISHEVWTLAEDGRPSKLMSKTLSAGSPIAGVETVALPDGRVAKVFKSKDGSMTHLYNRETGRLLETTPGELTADERARSIETELKGAGGNPSAATSASGNAAPQRAITLTRVAEDGSISHEVWTTDADGRPEKLLAKAPGSPHESPIVAAKTSVLSDGRIMKQFTVKKGTTMTRVYDPKERTVTETQGGTTKVYDSNMGRLIEIRSLADPASATSADAAEQTHTAASQGDAVAEPSRAKAGGQPPRLSQAPPATAATDTEIAGLSLVELATAYADAVGAVEAAEAELASLSAKVGPESDLASAKAALHRARRKQEVLRNLATVAADTARADVERAQQLLQAGAPATQQSAAANAAELRWKILSAILQSGPTGKIDPRQPGESPKSP